MDAIVWLKNFRRTETEENPSTYLPLMDDIKAYDDVDTQKM